MRTQRSTLVTAIVVSCVMALASCRDDANRTRAEHADSYPAQMA